MSAVQQAESPGPLNPKGRSSRESFDKRIERVLSRAAWSLWTERIWPPLLAVHFTLLAFLGVVWLGWLAFLPDWARWVVNAGFALSLGFLLVSTGRRSFGTTAIGRSSVIARVERVSDLSHQPLATLNDELSVPEAAQHLPVSAETDSSAETRALWAAHRARSLQQLEALKAGFPRLRFFAGDPFALRVVAGILFVSGVTLGQGTYLERFVGAFALSNQETQPLRVDIWANPPSYTNRAPLVLSYADQVSGMPGTGTITLPEGSELTVRIQGSDHLEPVFRQRTDGDLVAFERQVTPTQIEGGPGASGGREEPHVFKVTLTEAGTFSMQRAGEQMAAWQLTIVADNAPEIALSDDPAINLNNTIRYSYEMDDDYGIASAHARYVPLNDELDAGARPLVDLPDHPLPLPSSRSRTGGASTTRDLTDHPLAGSKVTVTLTATDQAGQTGSADPFVLDLPSRVFRKPIARALVDQRRRLALDARRQVRVLEALDALMIAPEIFTKDYGAFLGLQMVQRRLASAQSDDELRDVLAHMWDLALAVEDGDLSEAERNLRDAQEALRRALENGASDEEIAQLTENLREAMRDYLQALAQNSQQQMGNPQQPLDGQQMQQSDLDRMLDQIQELAQSGARDAAQQMLSQFQQMLDNMRAAGQQQGPGGQQNPMSEAMRELGDIIRRQRELMDQTFQQQQGNQQPQGQRGEGQGQRGEGQGQGQGQEFGQQPMTPEQLAEALRQLQQQQNALSQRLQDLRDQLGDMGLGEEQGEAFGDAGEAMDRAEGALGDGAPGQAVGPQGQALDALRRGIDELAEAMQSGPGGQQQAMPGGSGQPNRDPLGRPRRTQGPDYGEATKIPDEIDIQRARRVLQELRRRLSNPERPQLELDYLERLLERF